MSSSPHELGGVTGAKPERDLFGYGRNPPHPRWPGGARVAVQFVLNVEEGAERSVLEGDDRSEDYLHEVPGRPARIGERDRSVEGMYEYGSRAGMWRILRLFESRGLPLTAFAVGRALELTPDIGRALSEAGHEVAGHGWRWFDYRDIPEEEERRHIRRTVEVIERICGRRPVGWYTGRVSANTRRLVREEGGFLYSSDAYNDDLPYWTSDRVKSPEREPPGGQASDAAAHTPAAYAQAPAPSSERHLIIPYTLLNNDARYLLSTGFASGADFLQLLKDAFDTLWDEGAEHPKMMSVGLHGRISGHPARAAALARFLDYVQEREGVWVCRREEIARHWASR
jgi:allantoinase